MQKWGVTIREMEQQLDSMDMEKETRGEQD